MLDFFIAVLLPLTVGSISGALTMNSMNTYSQVVLPSFAPPSWLFPIVWTILYILMGIASFLIYRTQAPAGLRLRAFWLYGAQLVVNFIWPLIFFSLQQYLAALICILLLLALIGATMVAFSKINKTAAWLMLPYLLWVSFAGILNLSIYLLNS